MWRRLLGADVLMESAWCLFDMITKLRETYGVTACQQDKINSSRQVKCSISICTGDRYLLGTTPAV